MKIGLNNIYTSFLQLLLIGCGSVLIYFMFIERSVTIPTLMIPFVLIAMLVSVGVLIGVLCYFRVLIIDDIGVFCYYPFLLRKKEIRWEDLKGIKPETYSYFNNDGRRVLLSSSHTNLSFSSLEFENFDTLVKALPNGESILREVNLSFYTPHFIKHEAIEYIAYLMILIFNLYIYLHFSFYDFWIFRIILFFNLLLLYSTISRLVKLLKIYKSLE